MQQDGQPLYISEEVMKALRTLKFGGKLDFYRRMHRLTVTKLAEKIGVSPDRMENLLEAKHEPRASDVIRIQNALNIFFEVEDFEEVL